MADQNPLSGQPPQKAATSSADVAPAAAGAAGAAGASGVARPSVLANREVKVRPLTEMHIYVYTKLFEPAPRRMAPGEDVVHIENGKGQMVAVRLTPEKVALFASIAEWNSEVQRGRHELMAAAAAANEAEMQRIAAACDCPWPVLVDPCLAALDIQWEDSPVGGSGSGSAPDAGAQVAAVKSTPS